MLFINSIIILLIHLIYFTKSQSKCSKYDSLCICSMARTIDELGVIITNTNPSEIKNKIENYECKHFERLPASGIITLNEEAENLEEFYEIERRRKRRIFKRFAQNRGFKKNLKRKKRSSKNQGGKFALLGSSYTIPCGTDEVLNELGKSVSSDGVEFIWTYFDGKSITTSQIQIDPQNGELTFENIQLSDDGKYNCTMTYKNFYTNAADSREFSTTVRVVSVPLFGLDTNFAYTSNSCLKNEITLMIKGIEDYIIAIICPICRRITQSTVKCRGDYSNGETQVEENFQGNDYIFKMFIYLDGFSIDGMVGINKCSLECKEGINMKMVEILRQSLTKFFNLQIETKVGESSTIHYPIPKLFTPKMIENCLDGYYETSDHYCFPCDKGEYSTLLEDSKCILCPVGQYQNSLAATACNYCPVGKTTLADGSLTESDCYLNTIAAMIKFGHEKIIVVIIAMILIPIIILLLIIAFCFPKSKCGIFLNRFCFCCCRSKKSKLSKKDEKNEKNEKKNQEGNQITIDGNRKVRETRPLPPPPQSQFKYIKEPLVDQSTRRNSHGHKYKRLSTIPPEHEFEHDRVSTVNAYETSEHRNYTNHHHRTPPPPPPLPRFYKNPHHVNSYDYMNVF